jgi:hypothetical protein
MGKFEIFQHLPGGALYSEQASNEELPNIKQGCYIREHNFYDSYLVKGGLYFLSFLQRLSLDLLFC